MHHRQNASAKLCQCLLKANPRWNIQMIDGFIQDHEGATLCQISDLQILARLYNRPLIGLFDSEQDTHERGLAAAVRANESNTFASADAK